MSCDCIITTSLLTKDAKILSSTAMSKRCGDEHPALSGTCCDMLLFVYCIHVTMKIRARIEPNTKKNTNLFDFQG